jgi:hypothetical protein
VVESGLEVGVVLHPIEVVGRKGERIDLFDTGPVWVVDHITVLLIGDA